jgi:hypothetical protein
MPNRSREVDLFMSGLDHPLKEGVERLRAAILDSNGGITEHVKWNAPSFCYAGEDRVQGDVQALPREPGATGLPPGRQAQGRRRHLRVRRRLGALEVGRHRQGRGAAARRGGQAAGPRTRRESVGLDVGMRSPSSAVAQDARSRVRLRGGTDRGWLRASALPRGLWWRRVRACRPGRRPRRRGCLAG